MKKKVSHVKRRMKSIIPMLLIVMLIFSTAPVGALVEDSSYGNDVVVSDQGYNETTDENNDANNDLSYGYGYEDRNDVYYYGDNDSYENDKMDYEYENKEVVREEDDVDEYEEEELYYMVASLLSLSGDVTVDNIADFDLALADGDIDTIIIDGTIHFDSQRTVSRNLTISGGTITTQLGGFLVNSGAELTLEDVTIQFTGVPAAWSAVRAAVRVTGGGSTLNLGSGSVIRDFHFPGTPIINNLLISAVSVVQGGTLNVLDGSEIYNNTRGISATDAGSTVIMSGGLIHGNINNAAFSAGVPNVHGGGAIYIGPLGHLYMSGGTITNNSLYGGGGGAVRLGQLYVGTTNNRPRATFTMTGGEISHNYSIRVGGAGGFGGGVDMLNTTMNMSGGVINNNTATHGTSGTGSGGGGGGISLRSGTMVNLSGDAVLHSNRAYTPGNFAGGGGIVLNGGSTFLDVSGNAEIHSNFSASGGGGVFLADSAGFINGVVHPGFTMSGGVIRDNTTDSFGAGVAMRGAFAGWQSRFVMTGGEIRNNIAAADHNGGGVHLGNLSEFTLDGGTISGNTARDGGGVYVTSGQSLRMQSGEISGNTVTRAGGGVRVTNTTFEMAGGLIDDNTAIYGGGVHVYGNNGAFVMAEPEISALVTTFSGNAITVSNNTAQYGGGIFVNENSTLEVTDGSITGNTAAFDGGAIFTGDYETGPIPTPGVAFENIEIGEDVIFSGNSAGNGSFPPPVNAGYFTNIQFASTSIYDDLLNNYDINFYNTRIAVTFNLQGGNIGGDTDDVIVSVGYGRAMANILAAIANPARTSHNFLGWS
ncbi:MAG: hypothetical protein FWC66_08615, partial [Oscillospiraceae bacterium]|nr:hypothetical protein [Oscillospiraceae bacterium]